MGAKGDSGLMCRTAEAKVGAATLRRDAELVDGSGDTGTLVIPEVAVNLWQTISRKLPELFIAIRVMPLFNFHFHRYSGRCV